MRKSDTSIWNYAWDIPAAFVLLTRLPLPRLPALAFENSARAVWVYPVVGLILGLAAALLDWFLLGLEVPSMIAAGLILTALIFLTGALHEDGLADTVDGFWGGHDRTRRLDIMKDSRIGTYGVLALILATGLRWLGISEASWTSVLTALVISRAMMPLLMLALPHARTSGLSHSVGTPALSPVLLASTTGIVLAIVFSGSAGLLAAIVSGALAVLMGAIATAKIGGQTGDVLGATQVLCEIAALLTLVTVVQ